MRISGRCALIAVIAAGCGSDTTPAPPDGAAGPTLVEQARDAFWTAFRAGRYQDVAAAREIARQAYAESPTDPEAARYALYSVFWMVGESDRAVPPMSEDQITALRMEHFQALQAARALSPNELIYNVWFGGTLLQQGLMQGDPELEGQGRAVLDEVAQQNRLGGLLMKSIVLRNAPAGSPPYEESVADLFAVLDWCVDGEIDRDQPVIDRSMWTDQLPKRPCWSNPHTPHFEEAAWLDLGDMLVKQGKLAAARSAYESARVPPSFAVWRDRGEVEARLASDLAARSALYWDDDDANDPTIGVQNSCTSCHSD